MICFIRPLSEDEIKVHTPVVITCAENRREVCAVQNIANKQIDRTFMFDKVCPLYKTKSWTGLTGLCLWFLINNVINVCP